MTLLRLSDVPPVTLWLGDPAILHREIDAGYLELEVGPLAPGDRIVRDLDVSWAGQSREWHYGFRDDRFFISVELGRRDERVMLRVDYHHMQIHLGVDWRVVRSDTRTHDGRTGLSSGG